MESYILNANGEPEHCGDLRAWGEWMKGAEARRVGLTEFDGGRVSTVFLGLDHRFTNSGEPILWETMIFGGPHDGYQDRYTSRQDAEHGHAKAVALAMEAPLVPSSEE